MTQAKRHILVIIHCTNKITVPLGPSIARISHTVVITEFLYMSLLTTFQEKQKTVFLKNEDCFNIYHLYKVNTEADSMIVSTMFLLHFFVNNEILCYFLFTQFSV